MYLENRFTCLPCSFVHVFSARGTFPRTVGGMFLQTLVTIMGMFDIVFDTRALHFYNGPFIVNLQ